jgi:hypothetical protein
MPNLPSDRHGTGGIAYAIRRTTSSPVSGVWAPTRLIILQPSCDPCLMISPEAYQEPRSCSNMPESWHAMSGLSPHTHKPSNNTVLLLHKREPILIFDIHMLALFARPRSTAQARDPRMQSAFRGLPTDLLGMGHRVHKPAAARERVGSALLAKKGGSVEGKTGFLLMQASPPARESLCTKLLLKQHT